MDTLSNFSTPTIGFLITVTFGLWLSKVGKPYNGVLFNVHKLVALGTVILTFVQVYKSLKIIEPQSLLAISIVITVMCVVALFTSGAFLSIGNVKYETVKLIHNVAPVILVLAMGGVIYLLFWRIS